MSTLADELLQDFEDSDSEAEEHQQNRNDLNNEEQTAPNNNALLHLNESQELDDDEDEDEIMTGTETNSLELGADENLIKASVEKMELGGVDDVRSVARKMKKIEPILEVSLF